MTIIIFFMHAIFFVLCICVFWIDVKTQRIPNLLNLSILSVSFILAFYTTQKTLFPLILETAFVFSILYIFSLLILKLKGKIGLGMGDVKFVTATTPLIGILNIPWMLFIASISALLWVFVEHKKDLKNLSKTKIPFGPFLVFAVLLTLGIKHFYNLELYEVMLIG